jgi:threonine dehydratase
MVDLQTIRQAHERIRSVTHRTPVMTSRSFDAAAGVRTAFKCENLQRGGAFKIRGASNFLLSIPEANLPRGVVAFSSGNHAQAVAIAARDLGISATIVMPSDAPRLKMEATRGYGATVIVYDRLRENREEIARRVAGESGATVVPPFDHEWIIAGQGTAALELLDEVSDLDAILVPVGGGGLISGCSIAAKSLNPSIRVIGVEPADGNDTFLSRKKGERVEIPAPSTIADGLRAPKPGVITFPIVQQMVDDIVLVTDDEIRAAVKFLLTRMKILVEPSGAVGAAALLYGRVPGVRKAGAILSGGNADLELLRELSPPS